MTRLEYLLCLSLLAAVPLVCDMRRLDLGNVIQILKTSDLQETGVENAKAKEAQAAINEEAAAAQAAEALKADALVEGLKPEEHGHFPRPRDGATNPLGYIKVPDPESAWGFKWEPMEEFDEKTTARLKERGEMQKAKEAAVATEVAAEEAVNAALEAANMAAAKAKVEQKKAATEAASESSDESWEDIGAPGSNIEERKAVNQKPEVEYVAWSLHNASNEFVLS